MLIVATYAQYIEVWLLNYGHQPDITHCIPQIVFDFQPSYVLYAIQWRQFPLHLAYSTTFNNCQGLAFDCVVTDSRCNVFVHSHLYTASSILCMCLHQYLGIHTR